MSTARVTQMALAGVGVPGGRGLKRLVVLRLYSCDVGDLVVCWCACKMCVFIILEQMHV